MTWRTNKHNNKEEADCVCHHETVLVWLCEWLQTLTFLPFSNGPPAARRQSTRDLFKIDVIVPILIKGMKQAWKTKTSQCLTSVRTRVCGVNLIVHRPTVISWKDPHTRSSPSLSEAWMGGETSGTNVSRSKRPVLDWAFSSQYRFSKSIMSDSSTAH